MPTRKETRESEHTPCRHALVRNDGTGPDGRWAVPPRRVFPWWYLVGAAATVAALILLDPEGGQAVIALWGPTIGIAIRDREKDARERLDQGRPVDRASLLSPLWLEPVCAALIAGFAVGLGLLLDALFGHRTFVTVQVGLRVLVSSAVGFVLLLVVLRARRRRRRTTVSGPDLALQAPQERECDSVGDTGRRLPVDPRPGDV